MTLTVHAMRPGDPRPICGEGQIFSGVPTFINCEACRSPGAALGLFAPSVTKS